MSEKYIDLAPQIASMHDQPIGTVRVVLGLLDRLAAEHPDQVPGRTITESDYRDLELDLSDGNQSFGAVVECLGITVVPDPEPTNAEKLADLLGECMGDVHDDRLSIADFLDSRGVKAPGANDPDTEHNRAWWIENANVNDAEDCEACVGDLCPVHHGIALGIEFVTKKIAALGDDPELFNSIPNPPKAPGGDDER